MDQGSLCGKAGNVELRRGWRLICATLPKENHVITRNPSRASGGAGQKVADNTRALLNFRVQSANGQFVEAIKRIGRCHMPTKFEFPWVKAAFSSLPTIFVY